MPFDDENYGMEKLHPAWRQGRLEFQRGRRLDDNPYDFGTDAYEAWAQGWQEALADDGQMTPRHDKRN